LLRGGGWFYRYGGRVAAPVDIGHLRIHLLFERPVLHDFATALTQLGVVIR
jgi:hypothetical protein